MLLNAFRHPLILASIGLLIVNDHILKRLFPSALTGKLSDFAGLFFFPFLLGVLLQVVFRLTARWALLAGIFSSALVFSALKLLPQVNSTAHHLLENLLGLPVQIILDPTDLIALLVFFPAWWLWVHMGKKPAGSQSPGRLAYAALVVGSLAAMATSHPLGPAKAYRVHSDGNLIYVGVGHYHRIDKVIESMDGGNIWKTSREFLDGSLRLPVGGEQLAQDLFAEPVASPLVICNPTNTENCYRISGTDVVENSNDGGRSWEIAWQIPSGRIDFMNRAHSYPFHDSPDDHFFDMAFGLEDGDTVLYLAMGNEGIIKLFPDGNWERIGIDPHYSLTPFWARNIGEAIKSTRIELTYILVLGLWFWLGLSEWINRSRKWRKVNFWAIFLFVISILICLILFLYYITDGWLSFLLEVTDFFIPILIALVIIDVYYLSSTWKENQLKNRWLYWFGFLLCTFIFWFAYQLFLFWAFGWIPIYSTALILSITSGLIMIAAAVFTLNKKIS
jgi:hypothetical protein